jgi:oxaloacetate decarboxylase gamma subunit
MAGGVMQAGLELLVLGMGTVFVFLALLVIATNVLSKLVAVTARGDGDHPDSETATAEEIEAVVAAAVAAHRARGR